MHNGLTNLLPRERRQALVRDYVLRLGVVALVLVTVLTLIAGGLLVPTYLLLVGNVHLKQARLAEITSKSSSVDETALADRLTALSANASALLALNNTLSASGIVRTVLAVARPGITVSKFSYTPVTTKQNKSGKGGATIPGTVVLSGTAATREALRSYQLALQGAPFATSATLPISTYAQDANIEFTITVTLKP